MSEELSDLVSFCRDAKKSDFSPVGCTVKGGLNRCKLFWEASLSPSPFASSIVNEGYSLLFIELPPPCCLRNNRSALRNSQFVESAILELLTQGLIREVTTPPHCVNPLTVAEGKKLKLVLDLREVNKYLAKRTFHYEDLRSLSEVFREGFWFFTWDLKSGYHHVDIFPPHQQYLGFSWSFSGVIEYFCFSVLPFWYLFFSCQTLLQLECRSKR